MPVDKITILGKKIENSRRERKITNATTQESFSSVDTVATTSLLSEITPSTKSNKIDVIISGHYNNQKLITSLKVSMESLGLTVWTTVDTSATSTVDTSAADFIKNKIKHCKCVLMCLTTAYEKSTLFNVEANLIVESKKPIVPIVIKSDFKQTDCEWVNKVLKKYDTLYLEDGETILDSWTELLKARLSKEKLDVKNTESTQANQSTKSNITTF